MVCPTPATLCSRAERPTERFERAVINAGGIATFAGRPAGAHEMGMGERDGAYVNATGLVCGKSHELCPWPGQVRHEGQNGVADETLAIHFQQKCGAAGHI